MIKDSSCTREGVGGGSGERRVRGEGAGEKRYVLEVHPLFKVGVSEGTTATTEPLLNMQLISKDQDSGQRVLGRLSPQVHSTPNGC